MEIMELATLVGNFSFPIAITAFVLVRLEGTVNKNTEAINSMKEAVLTWNKQR